MEKSTDLLKECLYDKSWCAMYGINYANPDINKAKEIIQQDKPLKTYKPKNI
jgi:hypothetical protein